MPKSNNNVLHIFMTVYTTDVTRNEFRATDIFTTLLCNYKNPLTTWNPEGI